MKLSFSTYTLSLLASLALVSCAKDYALVGTEREKGGTPIWLSTSVTVQNTRAAGAVSNDAISPTTSDWESKVVSLRMIISDSQTGTIVYNEKEDNPTELTDRFTQTSGEQSIWRRPIKIVPGTYDFWFIANEGVNWFAPTETNPGRRDHFSELSTQVWDKLTVGSNIARIFDGKVFTGADAGYAPLAHLDMVPYRKYVGRDKNPIWTPIVGDVDLKKNELWGSWSLNRPMPMSAVYKNVDINNTRNNKGMSEQDPQHFIAGGDEKVKLVRCMAKVTINVEKAAHVNDAKKVDYLQWPALGKFAITLLNRPRYWSFFNTPLFDMNHTPRQFKFYSDIFPDDESRYRAVVINHGGNSAPESYGGIVYDSPSKSDADLKRYRYTFYVPELLLPKHPLDGEPNGGQAYDRLNAVMLAFSAPSHGFSVKVQGKRTDFFNDLPSADESVNYYPYSSKAEFEAVLDDSKAFNLGTADLTERNDNTDNPRLPNPQWYSKFSLLRNRHYEYTIREKDRLQVEAVIAPWNEEPKSETLVFDEVQVKVPDPSFSAADKQMKLRIQNAFASPNHLYDKIRISLLNQDGGENSQAYFTNYGTMTSAKSIGQKVVQLIYGGDAAHHAGQGFVDFVVNWSATTGNNAPAIGKGFIKLEYLNGQGQPQNSPSGRSYDIISVGSADWSKLYRDFESAQ